jgi:hypothetical protein
MSPFSFLSISTVGVAPDLNAKKASSQSVTTRDNSFRVKFVWYHPANSLWGVSFATRLLKAPLFLTKIPH